MTHPYRRFTGARHVLVSACTSALLTSCASSTPAEKPEAPAAAPQAAPVPPAPKPTYGTFGFDLSGMDRSVTPGNDFNGFANGTWIKQTEIPADRSSYSSFTTLTEQADRRNRQLIEEQGQAAEGSEARKVGDLFASYMDEAAIEARGAAPLKPELERIAAISQRSQLATALGATLRADVDALNMGDVTTDRLFGLWVAEDFNEPSRYAPYLLQGGLWLPDRDYYLVDSPRFAEVRKSYQAHIAAMLKLAGFDDVEARAGRVLALERKMAQAHWSQVDTRDVSKANNPWPRAEFAKRAPGLAWNEFFNAAGLGAQADFIVWQPSALKGLSKLTQTEPLQAWKDYLAFHAVARGAAGLSKAFVDESFAFNGKTLSGVPTQRERWKRGLAHQPVHGRGRGQAVRGPILPAGREGGGGRHGPQHHHRVRQAHRRADVDVAGDAHPGEAEGVHAPGQHRPPGAVA